MKNIFLIILVTFIFSGCANPLNEATFSRYDKVCSDAERIGDFATAEQACYRALVNVDIGNLGPEKKSVALYNLGRIKKKVGKYDEAEDLLKQSLKIEESLSGPTSEKIGRRLAELAMTYGAKGKFIEGVPYLEKIEKTIQFFNGPERDTLARIFYIYGDELNKIIETEKAKRFIQISSEINQPKTK